MNARMQNTASPRGGPELKRREFYSYVSGVVLALILTLVPFGLVHFGHARVTTVYWVIGCLAFVQMIVHFRFFLHIGFRQKREDLQLILFSAVLLIIMIGGTVWIMGSLAGRMMLPLHP